MTTKGLKPYAVGAAAGAFLTLLLCWWMWHASPVPESQSFERALPSGGTVLARDPEAKPPAPIIQAAREAGGKIERAVRITVRPDPLPLPTPAVAKQLPAAPSHEGADSAAVAPTCECKPVHVDLALIRMRDQTRRVVATAEGGTILGGLDIPIETRASAQAKKWGVGVTVAFTHTGQSHYGAFVDRDLGPLRLGVEVGQREGGAAVTLRAGIRF